MDITLADGSSYVGQVIASDNANDLAIIKLQAPDEKLRTLDGEAIHIHNSQIPAVKVLPRGVKELAVELFVSDRERAEQLITWVAAMLPEGPTTLVRRPWIESVDEFSESVVRIAVRATTAGVTRRAHRLPQ